MRVSVAMTAMTNSAAPAGKPGWIVTHTGRRVWPLELQPSDIVIDDIAHALAMKCRWGGFCRSFYSVAQHAVLLAAWLERNGGSWQDQWDALHHDDSEAYLFDLPDPLKVVLPEFLEIENRLQGMIGDIFGCSPVMSERVAEADRRIRADEAAALMVRPSGGWGDHGGGLEPLGIKITPWPPDAARAAWFAAYDRLQGSRRKAAMIGAFGG